MSLRTQLAALLVVPGLLLAGCSGEQTEESDAVQNRSPHETMNGAAATTSKEVTEPVEKPEGGRSIAELWDARGSMVGEEVTLRGRVVKYNPAIMGRNWIHIQDGTGDAAAGTHDVTITTQAEAAVGDVVLVTGKVAVDRDFGGGYQYGLIVEDATVAKE